MEEWRLTDITWVSGDHNRWKEVEREVDAGE